MNNLDLSNPGELGQKAEPKRPAFRVEGKWRQDLEELGSSIEEVLLSENLVVLTGLGTSLCLKGEGDKPIAPGMWDLWERVVVADPLSAGFKEQVGYEPPEGKENIETFLSRCQMFGELFPSEDLSNYVRAAEMKIANLCDFIQPTSDLKEHKQFLLKVGRRPTRQPRMQLFTTNYDRCFEQAANDAGFIVIDGFTHTYPQQFDGAQFSYDFVRRHVEKDVPDYIPNVFHLYKVHGSVDWEKPLDQSDRKIIKASKPSHPAMIFPRKGKYELSYHQPYFELMSRFQAALRQPNTGLLIIGFGFSDDHITEPIRVALDTNVGLKCCVVTPGWQDPKRSKMLDYIKALADSGDRRIIAIDGKFEEFVPVIPHLVAETEQEKHSERLKLGGRR